MAFFLLVIATPRAGKQHVYETVDHNMCVRILCVFNNWMINRRNRSVSRIDPDWTVVAPRPLRHSSKGYASVIEQEKKKIIQDKSSGIILNIFFYFYFFVFNDSFSWASNVIISRRSTDLSLHCGGGYRSSSFISFSYAPNAYFVSIIGIRVE
jgi:hypothetical protein